MKRESVVCYERAAGRIRNERAGRADAAFLRGVLKAEYLPTAVGNASDHYVLLTPGGEPRFLTVEEVARGFQIPAGSPLMRMLSSPTPLTVIQAVSCLGQSIHVGVGRSLVSKLLGDGVLTCGLSYGSAYSGIDTFAAAVDVETCGKWAYMFVSEKCKTVRKALLSAWGCRGLEHVSCYKNACSSGATTAPYVDLWVISPSCEAYSRRNHSRKGTVQARALCDVGAAFEYVHTRRPRVVVVENVNEKTVSGPLTGILSRLKGYSIEAGPLDPRVVANAPMERDRHFWVLTRLD